MVDLTYQASVQPEALPGRAIPRLPDEANPQAFGGQVGGAIENAADVVQRVAKQAETLAIRTQATDGENKLQVLTIGLTRDPQTGALTKEGQAAFGLTDQYIPKYDAGAQAIIDGIADPRARLAVSQSAAHMRNTLTEQLDSHEISQHKQYANDTAQAGVKLAIQSSASNYNNGNMLQANLERIDGNIETLAMTNGWSDEQKQVALNQAHSEAHQSVLTAMIADNKPDMAQHYLDAFKSEMPPAEYERNKLLVQKGEADQAANGIVSQFRQFGAVAGAKALQQLDKTDMDPDLKQQVYAATERGINQWHAEARDTHGAAIMGLEERLASGKTTPADIGLVGSLFKNGALTAEQAGGMKGRMEKSQEAAVDDDSIWAAANQAYQQGQALDPKDKSSKAGIAEVFSRLTQGLDPGSQEWINRGADIAAKTGITPAPVVSWARTQLNGGPPQLAAQAADAIARQQDANPRGLGDALDARTKTMARTITDAVHAGTDPLTAVENARKLDAMPDADRKRLQELYTANAGKIPKSAAGDLASEIKADPDWRAKGIPFFRTLPPDPPPSMAGEFEALRQEYFKLTNGNITQANDLAFHDLKNTWGVTQVNGKREFMQFAPESMNPGLTTDFLRKDMESSAAGLTPDPSKVRLVPTAATWHSEGQLWGLAVPDKFGAYDVVRDAKGNPIPYQIPTAAASVAAARAKAAEDGMAKLHAAQSKANQATQDIWDAIKNSDPTNAARY